MSRVMLVAFVAATVTLSGGAILVAAEESDMLLDGKLRAGDSIRVGAEEEIADDLYLFGSSVTVDADVPGDLIVFGSDVTIRGDVGGDVLSGSSTLIIAGDVAGDVRAGAGTMQIDGAVDEDVAAGAGVLTLNGDIGGDVLFGAGQAGIAGDVEGSVEGSTGVYNLTGSIGGTENVTINEPAEFDEPARPEWLRAISRYVSIALLGGVLVAWQRRPTRAALERLGEQPASSLLWGAMLWGGLILASIGGVLLAIALALIFGFLTLGQLVGVGVFTGLLMTLLSVFLLVVGTVVVGPALAGAALGEFALQRHDDPPIWGMLLGLAALVALGLIPVVGWMVNGLAVLFGLGALVVAARHAGRAADQAGNGPALA